MEYRRINGRLVPMTNEGSFPGFKDDQEHAEFQHLTKEAQDLYGDAREKGLSHKEAIEYAASKMGSSK